MTFASRDAYARLALEEIPRILGNQDRNPYSKTYGCIHRDYWMDKTSDFPDAVRQFGVQALALVYTHDFPGNVYKGNERMHEWTVAGMKFWAEIQHKDGSFDEFYPFERGWVGPTAFTTYAISESLMLLGDNVPDDVARKVREAIHRAATFIAKGQQEEDHLANHHAMACLAVWKAYEVSKDPQLKSGFERLWKGFLTYHDSSEGWSREYDGVDPGYLSAVVSFLGKIYKTNKAPEILDVIRQSSEFCSYFVYPNGFYAGMLGSRNTLHFYPHGFEVVGKEIPVASAVAEKMLEALSDGKLVPPRIMADRYQVYRVPEFLQAYLDYSTRPTTLAKLPCEEEGLRSYFPNSRIFAASNSKGYVIANLAKGGVMKVFNRGRGPESLLVNDGGVIGWLSDGRVVSSQWVDPSYQTFVGETSWEVSGHLQEVPSAKVFTPIKGLIFRVVMVGLGWSARLSHFLKGAIRKNLMLGTRPTPVRFTRHFDMNEDGLTIRDELEAQKGTKIADLSVGGEFAVRYVPQSRYFQIPELESSPRRVSSEEIGRLNSEGKIVIERRYSF